MTKFSENQNRSRRWVVPLLTAVTLAVAIIASSAFNPAPAEAATIIGADLGGGDLNVSDGDILSGTFTNVGTFTIPAGVTVFVDPGTPLSITANTIIISGTLDGSGAGSPGGAPVPIIPSCVPHGTVTGNAGSGPGGGGGGLFGCNVHGGGGGGGGYGGAGGVSSSFFGSEPGPTPGGVAFGDATSPSSNLGSGGGSGSAFNQTDLVGFSGAGGAGGAAISLFGTVDLDGAILADGADGALPTGQNGAGGGGGSGGGVLLDGTLLLNGFISATGGDGVAGTFSLFSSGGGGGGGRIKLFGQSVFQAGFSFDVSGGGFGQSALSSGGTEATAGEAGTFADTTTPIPPPDEQININVVEKLSGAKLEGTCWRISYGPAKIQHDVVGDDSGGVKPDCGEPSNLKLFDKDPSAGNLRITITSDQRVQFGDIWHAQMSFEPNGNLDTFNYVCDLSLGKCEIGPVAVGGLAVDLTPLAESSDNAGLLAGVAGAIAAGAIALGGAYWYARRQWL